MVQESINTRALIFEIKIAFGLFTQAIFILFIGSLNNDATAIVQHFVLWLKSALDWLEHTQ